MGWAAQAEGRAGPRAGGLSGGVGRLSPRPELRESLAKGIGAPP